MRSPECSPGAAVHHKCSHQAEIGEFYNVTSYQNIYTFIFNRLTTLPFEEMLLESMATLSSVTFSDPKGILFFFSSSKMAAYSRRAPNTMMMQTTRYRSIAFKLDEMGASALKNSQ